MMSADFLAGRESAARDLKAEAAEYESQFGNGFSSGARAAAVLYEAARLIRLSTSE